MLFSCIFFFFFFKQKTAYEMRISDWSSDVCSSDLVQTEPYLKARVTAFGELKTKADKKFDALVNSVKDLAMQIIETSPNIPTEAGIAIKTIENSSFLSNFISSNMNAAVADKQKLLEITALTKRPAQEFDTLSNEQKILELK